MFEKERKFPASLEECKKVDSVSESLWTWVEWLKKWGKIILILLIVVGIISAVGKYNEVNEINVDSGVAMMSAVTSLLSWALYAIIEFFAYNALALLLSALASIVQDTRITANVALYRAAKDMGIKVGVETKSGKVSYSALDR
ncbi:MAG: hypothetical protein E7403_03050 [Ruminococcaceae bacterium]|nr:hypothetical protein [Oscillospiraceae bacterium]